MKINIAGTSLNRLVTLSEYMHTDSKRLAKKVLRTGLDIMERLYKVNDNVKRFIAAHPELDCDECAARLHITPPVVRRYRRELAYTYLMQGEWALESDPAIGKRFGLPPVEIFRMRLSARLLRCRGIHPEKGDTSPDKYIRQLGGVSHIKYLLTEGGKNLPEIFAKAGITGITRERGRQILNYAGLTANESNRTVLWYANRFLPDEKKEWARKITDQNTLRRLLAEAGGVRALAGRLGISRKRLTDFAVIRVGLCSAEDRRLMTQHGEMVELHCSETTQCGRVFYRLKSEMRHRQEHGATLQTLFFCCKECQGRYLGTNHSDKKVRIETTLLRC